MSSSPEHSSARPAADALTRNESLSRSSESVSPAGGIVADSDPASEQRECEAKAGALLAAAREAARVAGEAGFGQ